ncbi:MAG TPA: EI24 domain-containing protein [Chitinophagaceae bacterium]|nr:EI24 domain-containing protein [Chitinophagaceae bacterium]
MLKEIVIAFQSWAEAHEFIRQHRFWKWIIGPGILYTILFIAGMIIFWRSADSAVSWASNQLRIEPWLQQKRSEWLSFFFLMTGMMLRLVMVLFYFSLFKYLILIIGSPVFAYLSEKTEAIIENREHSFNWGELRKDCARSIKLALRNCLWQTFYLFTLILLSLVPVVGWITPVIALMLEFYYYGFSMLDYSLTRNQFSPSQSLHFIGRHKGLAISNGFLFYLMHAVIIFAPAYAIIAGTLTVHKVKTS